MREIVKALRKIAELDNWEQVYQEYISLDRDLHRLIVEIAGNTRLQSIWEQVNVYGEMGRIRYGRSEEARLTQQEHEEILRGFEAGDIVTAQKAVSQHIERVKRSIVRHFEYDEA
jgi:DNA-binding GntR family transcriptional regulator